MKTRTLALTAIFIAIILLLSLTPFGFINLGFIKGTIVHVPVIIGSIILGPRVGALLGLVFGATSLFINTTTPSLLSFAFSPFVPVLGTNHGSIWALVICFVPRILVGVLPYYFYHLAKRTILKKEKQNSIALGIAGVGGSLVNTLLVMNLIYFIFQDAYAAARELPIGESVYKAVLIVIFVNGIPEAILAGACTIGITIALQTIMRRQKPLS